jgi:hypothetical protein
MTDIILESVKYWDSLGRPPVDVEYHWPMDTKTFTTTAIRTYLTPTTEPLDRIVAKIERRIRGNQKYATLVRQRPLENIHSWTMKKGPRGELVGTGHRRD